MTVKIGIDMDRKCRKCGKLGAHGNGYCLTCTPRCIWNPNIVVQILPEVVKNERDKRNKKGELL